MKKLLIFFFPLFCGMLLAVATGCRKAPDSRGKLSFTGDSGIAVCHNGKELGKLPLTLRVSPGKYIFKYQSPKFQTGWQLIELKAGENKTVPVAPTPKSAEVLITSTPSGAELIQGEKTIGVTPLILRRQTLGLHKAQLRLNGYAEIALEWEISDERPKSLAIPLYSNTGSLRIDSVPSQARLQIAGREVGVTPYQSEMVEGQYRIRMEKEGYTVVERNIRVKRSTQTREKIRLVPLPGGLTIHSTPSGADIYINNEKRAVTPCVLTDLVPAVYEIRAEKTGYDSQSIQQDVTAGFRNELNFQLQSSTGGIMLQIKPVGVTVRLNDRPVGKVKPANDSKISTAPIHIGGLAPGEYTVSISHPRAVPTTQSFKVKVEKGKQTRPKPVSMWVANCEIQYLDGKIEQGVLFHENPHAIMFGPEPGVRGTIRRNKLVYVKYLEDPEVDEKSGNSNAAPQKDK